MNISQLTATAGQDEDSTLSPGGKYVYMQDLHTLDKRVPQLRGALPESACKVLTPLKVASWADALKDYPDQELAEYLLRGIVQGFHIGFDYSRYCSLTGDLRREPGTEAIHMYVTVHGIK